MSSDLDNREKWVLDKYSTQGLRRNILTESAKRWQLWRIGINGKEADEVIKRIYAEEASNVQ